MDNLQKIGFGGGCHWCTEAVFLTIIGVKQVDQGYISVEEDLENFYEGVIVYYDQETIGLEILIEIHLRTHQSTSNHSMRSKYLSAVYVFEEEQKKLAAEILKKLQKNFHRRIITEVYDFGDFKPSRKEIRNYYKTDPERPFCKMYIDPKLEKLRQNFANHLK